jgi:hypothetical protein
VPVPASPAAGASASAAAGLSATVVAASGTSHVSTSHTSDAAGAGLLAVSTTGEALLRGLVDSLLRTRAAATPTQRGVSSGARAPPRAADLHLPAFAAACARRLAALRPLAAAGQQPERRQLLLRVLRQLSRLDATAMLTAREPLAAAAAEAGRASGARAEGDGAGEGAGGEFLRLYAACLEPDARLRQGLQALVAHVAIARPSQRRGLPCLRCRLHNTNFVNACNPPAAPCGLLGSSCCPPWPWPRRPAPYWTR